MNWKDALKKLKGGKAVAGTASNGAMGDAGDSAAQSKPASSKSRPKRDLCIGLDFGTSSTKCVVRLLPVSPAWAVHLTSGAGGADPYLAPTRLWVDPEGSLSLKKKKAGAWAEELKVRLMERPWIPEAAAPGVALKARPVDLAAGYLALVLRTALDWCEANVRPKLGGAEFRWSFNLGIPVRDYDAREIKEAFEIAARTAWNLAWHGKAVDIAQAAELNDLAKKKALDAVGIEFEQIQVVPEVAAGVASYARSRKSRHGPHLFVDVGATTLDTSMFLLVDHEDGLRYTFLWADVNARLGAFRLHRRRVEEIVRLVRARFAASDPLRPIPSRATDCIPPKAEVEAIDAAFAEECLKTIGSVIYRAKLKAPTEISVPKSGPKGQIQVLQSGGGIRLPLYQEVVVEAGRRAAPGGGQGLLVRPFTVEALPRPPELEPADLADDTWQRLAIACGLSFRYEDIGDFIPPSAVDKAPLPVKKDTDSAFVGKEQI